MENLVPLVTTNKNFETHGGTHKGDEETVFICMSIFGRKKNSLDKVENVFLEGKRVTIKSYTVTFAGK